MEVEQTVSFVDKVRKTSTLAFEQMKSDNGSIVASYFVSGCFRGISGYIQRQVIREHNMTPCIEIRTRDRGVICRIGAKVVERGDSSPVMPTFELGPLGEKWFKSDKLSFEPQDISDVGFCLTLDDEVIKCLVHGFRHDICEAGEWRKSDKPDSSIISDPDKDKKCTAIGINFENNADAGCAAASVILTIFEILCNYKDASNDIEYEVNGFGKFKVRPSGDRFEVGVTFDKNFENGCKVDNASALKD